MKANFSTIYNEIYAKYGKQLEALRKEVLYKDIIIIIVAVVVGFGAFNIFPSGYETFAICVLMIIFAICLIAIAKVSKRYVEMYKLKAVKTLVEFSNKGSKYIPKSGIRATEYNASKFDTHWDDFYSEDYIEGNISEGTSFRMSQVKTTETHETTDSQGRRTTTTTLTFLGLYGIISLPSSCSNNIMITGNSFLRKFSKSRIEMESAEFEKYFDVMSTDRVKAMEILTQDTIQKLIDFRNQFKRDIKIKLDGTKIYFRIDCGDIFEPPTFRSAVGFDIMKKYFSIIETPIEIYDMLIDNIALTSDDRELLHKRRLEKLTPEEKKVYEEAQIKKEESGYFSTK